MRDALCVAIHRGVRVMHANARIWHSSVKNWMIHDSLKKEASLARVSKCVQKSWISNVSPPDTYTRWVGANAYVGIAPEPSPPSRIPGRNRGDDDETMWWLSLYKAIKLSLAFSLWFTFFSWIKIHKFLKSFPHILIAHSTPKYICKYYSYHCAV